MATLSWLTEPALYVGGSPAYVSAQVPTPKGSVQFRIERGRRDWKLILLHTQVGFGTSRQEMALAASVAEAKKEAQKLYRETVAVEKGAVMSARKNPKAPYIFKKGWPSGWDVWETGVSSSAAGSYLGHMWTRDGAYFGQVQAPTVLGPFKSRGAAAQAVERAFREKWKGAHGGVKSNPFKVKSYARQRQDEMGAPKEARAEIEKMLKLGFAAGSRAKDRPRAPRTHQLTSVEAQRLVHEGYDVGSRVSRGVRAQTLRRMSNEEASVYLARRNPAKGSATQSPAYLAYRKVVDAAEAEMMRQIATFAGKPLAERRAAMVKAREEYDRIANAAWDNFKATKQNPHYAADFVAPDTAKVVKLFSKSGFTDIRMKKLSNPQRLSREEFERRYWRKTAETPQGAAGVPASTRREFYQDYRESGLSFAAYQKATTTHLNPNRTHTARPAPSAKRERAHKNPGPRAYAHLGYSKDWHPKFNVGNTVYKTLHVGPFDIPIRGRVTRICKRGEGRLGAEAYAPHYDVTWNAIGKGAEKKLLAWAKKTAGHAYVHPNILHPEPESRVPETRLRERST